jgi:hypothetical protein
LLFKKLLNRLSVMVAGGDTKKFDCSGSRVGVKVVVTAAVGTPCDIPPVFWPGARTPVAKAISVAGGVVRPFIVALPVVVLKPNTSVPPGLPRRVKLTALNVLPAAPVQLLGVVQVRVAVAVKAP